jgi:FkbM family methyltransferase
MQNCAVLQLEAVHEGIVPSLVYALNRLGYRPTLYINEKCRERRGDIFQHMTALSFNLNYVPINLRSDWDTIAEAVRHGEYNFIMLSTFQNKGIIQWATKLGIPVIGVVHNVKLFLDAMANEDLLSSGHVKLCCLSPHVAVYLHQRLPSRYIDDVAVIEPVYWGERASQDDAISLTMDERRVLAIPGGVKFETRAFQELIVTLVKSVEFQSSLICHVLGGGEDRRRIEEITHAKQLDKIFQFAPLGPNGSVMYDDYITALNNANFVYPLLPLSFAPYREHKITSALSTAAGFELPIVLDRWTARVYCMPAMVSDATIVSSLDQLMQVTPKEIAALRAEMRLYREASLLRNTQELHRLIERLTRQPLTRQGVDHRLIHVGRSCERAPLAREAGKAPALPGGPNDDQGPRQPMPQFDRRNASYNNDEGQCMMQDEQYCFFISLAETTLRNSRRPPRLIARQYNLLFRILAMQCQVTMAVEIGAFEAGFARWWKSHDPKNRAIAFEANPFVFAQFQEEVRAAGVDYRNACVADINGRQKLLIPRDYRDKSLDRSNRMSSILNNNFVDQVEELEVDSVCLNEAISVVDTDRLLLKIDVKGACEAVLSGAAEALARTALMTIELESESIWHGQWLDVDVVRCLHQYGLILVARDLQHSFQYNAIFLNPAMVDMGKLTPVVKNYLIGAGRFSPKGSG